MTTQKCDCLHTHDVGICRREAVQVGFLGAFGVFMHDMLRPHPAAALTPSLSRERERGQEVGGRAKNVILVWMPGGPPQMQLWDLKPESPQECRGSAKPISTSAPGIQIGSRLPLTALQMHHLAIVRTITMGKEDENHIPGHQLMLAGINKRPSTFKSFATRNDWPSIGSVISALRPNASGMPTAVHLPLRVKYEGAPVPGEGSGWLGSKYEPWFIEQDPNKTDFHVPDLAPLPALTAQRLERRQQLLSQIDTYRRDLDKDLSARQLTDSQQRAFKLMTATQTARAFDLGKEPDKLRDRYGRTSWGQSLLLARRLAQAGVKYVQVNIGGLNAWDYHRTEDKLMDRMIPQFDQAFSAFIEDVHQQGMLSETLVICMSEMGRNPVLGKTVTGAAVNAAESDGRNHWQYVWSGVFAGAGVHGGSVIGESDAWAGYPNSEGYYPADFAATIFHAMGIDLESTVRDVQERPAFITEGKVIAKLFS